jgi:pimeloyl-ACP methyl ester carboxylesterase
MLAALFVFMAIAPSTTVEPSSGQSIEIRLDEAREVSINDVVSRLAKAGRIAVAPPPTRLSLPVDGVSGALTRSLLADSLGPEIGLDLKPDALVLSFPDRFAEPAGRAELVKRLRILADRAERAANSRLRHGMRAMASYRPNDPSRPTVCLVHGLNSSSGGFVHMIPPLEAAGYGVVVFDYPFNRPIDESCDRFRHDWTAFRDGAGERRPWAIVAHSMGCLIGRALIEGTAGEAKARELNSLIMIAPVNQGSNIAKLQNVQQFLSGLRAINGKEKTRAFAILADGVGKAAEDLLPGSRFLEVLNRNDRRSGVAYHILAGDSGFVTRQGRRQIESKLDEVARVAGIFGTLARLATADLPALLDEISDGTGDGCVSVERTRLGGVPDHRTIHANHAELIRAPLLFPDPGPVACMPIVLEWLKEDMPRTTPPRSRRPAGVSDRQD